MIKKEEIEKKEKAVSSVPGSVKVEKVLVENFISLQHVMTNLAVKFDNLSAQISKLLELFEISAKTLAEKGGLGDEKNQRVAEKLDNLLEQNKVIARGISLLHEKNSQEYAIQPPVQRFYPPQQQNQRFSSETNTRFKR